MEKKYLDDGGLAQVADHVNLKPNVFKGSIDAWDELTSEEKAKYAKGLVILSDTSAGDLSNYNGERVVNHTGSSTSFNIEPNVLHVFGSLAELEINFVPGVEGVVNDYHFIFISGSTATNLTLPDAVYVGDFTVEANKIYEVSIVENLLVYQDWSLT